MTYGYMTNGDAVSGILRSCCSHRRTGAQDLLFARACKVLVITQAQLSVGCSVVQDAGQCVRAACAPLGASESSNAHYVFTKPCDVDETPCLSTLTGHLGNAGGRGGAGGGPGRGRGTAGGHASGRLPAQRLHSELALARLLLPRGPPARGTLHTLTLAHASLQPQLLCSRSMG